MKEVLQWLEIPREKYEEILRWQYRNAELTNSWTENKQLSHSYEPIDEVELTVINKLLMDGKLKIFSPDKSSLETHEKLRDDWHKRHGVATEHSLKTMYNSSGKSSAFGNNDSPPAFIFNTTLDLNLSSIDVNIRLTGDKKKMRTYSSNILRRNSEDTRRFIEEASRYHELLNEQKKDLMDRFRVSWIEPEAPSK